MSAVSIIVFHHGNQTLYSHFSIQQMHLHENLTPIVTLKPHILDLEMNSDVDMDDGVDTDEGTDSDTSID